jgi:serine/threonine-protein kinase
VISLAHDEELHRDVALKKIKGESADDLEMRRRFLLEAETTGNLEHPGIVPVYSLGYDREGSPFYAMRFIRGKRLEDEIKQFHDAATQSGRDPGARVLELQKLLRRMLDVCNTVTYAHSRGIMHRDLKPSNIMVGPYGETLVLDWGLAKATGVAAQGALGAASPLIPASGTGSADTLPGSALGTPAYMSPEQARSNLEGLGPPSDVYSLGATLYCLLTGKAPFAGETHEVIEAVRAGEFQPPRLVASWIDPALEAVCTKAMALEPAGRYRSAQALADDIERWIAGEAVSAWREPLSRRLRRWMRRRQRLVTGAAAAALVALAGLLAFSLRERQSSRHLESLNQKLQEAGGRAERARRRAEDRVELALRSVEHFQHVVDENLDVKDRPELAALRTHLLHGPREFYRRIVDDMQGDPESEPEARSKLAEALLGLASVTGALDSESEAIRLTANAIDVLEPLADGHHVQAGYQFLRARALIALALLQGRTSDRAGAMASAQQGRQVYQELIHGDRADERYRLGLAQAETCLGSLRSSAGQREAALVHYGSALDLLRNLVREAPHIAEYQGALAQAVRNLGVIQHEKRQFQAARASYDEARATFQRLALDFPTMVRYREGLADAYFNLGNLYAIDLADDESRANHNAALLIAEELVREQPSVTEHRARLARYHGQKGALLRYSNPTLALASLESARDVLEGLVHENPGVIKYRIDLALTHYFIGDRQEYFGRYALGLASFMQGREIAERLVRDVPDGPEPRRVLAALWDGIGATHADQRRLRDAIEAYRASIDQEVRAHAMADAHTKQWRESAYDVIDRYEKLARIQRDADLPQDAMKSLRAALDMLGEFEESGALEYYLDARLWSQYSGLIALRHSKRTPGEEAERQRYSDLAAAYLRKWAAAAHGSFSEVKSDERFEPVRSRPDFPLLMMDLEMPERPFAPVR